MQVIDLTQLSQKFYIFAPQFPHPHPHGDIAQLARARDWQSRGQGFDSPYLHIDYQDLFTISFAISFRSM